MFSNTGQKCRFRKYSKFWLLQNNFIINLHFFLFQDYHVILVQKPASEKAVVYDMDSIMSFPCPLDLYLHQAIQSEKSLKKDYHR